MLAAGVSRQRSSVDQAQARLNYITPASLEQLTGYENTAAVIEEACGGRVL